MSSQIKPKATALERFASRFGWQRTPPPLQVSMAYSPPKESGLWVERNLLGRVQRGLHAIDQRAMIDKCYGLYLSNPFARRIIEMQKAFVIGTGLSPRAKHPLITALLERFWERNQMSLRVPNIQRDKCIFGEHIPRLLTNAAGEVALGSIDPLAIEELEIDPLNSENVLGVFVSYNGTRHKLRTVQRDLLGVSATQMPETYKNVPRENLAGRLTGEVMMFSVNKPSGAYRGTSDLYPIADALEILDEMSFNFADRVKLANYIHFVVTVTGATPEQVAEMNKEGTALYIPPPKPGQRVVISDKMKIDSWSPNLNAADMKEAVQTALLPVAAGSYNSIHDFGLGEDVNRASASEMNSPRDKFFTERQIALIGDVWQLDEFAIEQKRIFLPQYFAGLTEADFEHTVEAGDVSARDESARANVYNLTLSAISAATSSGVFTHEQAVEIAREATAAAGFAVDWDKLGGMPKPPETADAPPNDINAAADAADQILAAQQAAIRLTN